MQFIWVDKNIKEGSKSAILHTRNVLIGTQVRGIKIANARPSYCTITVKAINDLFSVSVNLQSYLQAIIMSTTQPCIKIVL